MKLRFTPAARRDLLNTKEYICYDLKNPSASEKIVSDILNSCYGLIDYPRLGMELSAKTGRNTDLLYLVSGKYLIFYRLEDDFISIIRIIDSRRNYIQIIFEE